MKNDQIRAIPRVVPPWPFEDYAHIISRIPDGEGGGYLITLPDFPGCMSDGESVEEAIANGRDAFLCVVSAMADRGQPIPAPEFRPEEIALPDVSGRFVTRVPRSIHAQLTRRARYEGVSLNALVLALIAEGLGRKAAA